MSRSKMTRLTLGAESYDPLGAPVLSLLFSRFAPNNRQEPIDIGRDLGGFGNLVHPADLTRKNVRRCSPRGSFKPSVGELLELLPWILNTTGVGGGTLTYTPGVAATRRLLEYTDAAVVYHRLLGLVVSKASFAATAGQEMTLDLELEGTDWTNPGAAAYPNWSNTNRFLFGDLALTLGGVATPCRNWRLTIDHKVANDRFYAGFVSAGALNLDRVVTFDFEAPYFLAASAWAAGQPDTGVAAALTLTAVQNGVTSTLAFNLPAIRYEHPSVDANVPDEQMIPVRAQCFGPTQARVVGGQPAPYTGAEVTAVLTP